MWSIGREERDMIKITVCIGSACHLKGSYNVITTFQNMIEEYNLGDRVELVMAFCLGHCQQAVSVQLDQETYSVSADGARQFFKERVLPQVTAC